MKNVPVGSEAPEEDKVQVEPVDEKMVRMQAMPQRMFYYRLERANQRAHICTRRYQMEMAQAIQSGAPIPPYHEDDFLEQEQFYPNEVEPRTAVGNEDDV